MARASLAEVIRLARLLVDGVEVVALLRWVLDVGRRHHKVAAVDDLRLNAVGPAQPEVAFLGVRVVVLLLLDDGRRAAVSLPQRRSAGHVRRGSRQIANVSRPARTITVVQVLQYALGARETQSRLWPIRVRQLLVVKLKSVSRSFCFSFLALIPHSCLS